jgi:hypothetical protein
MAGLNLFSSRKRRVSTEFGVRHWNSNSWNLKRKSFGACSRRRSLGVQLLNAPSCSVTVSPARSDDAVLRRDLVSGAGPEGAADR